MIGVWPKRSEQGPYGFRDASPTLRALRAFPPICTPADLTWLATICTPLPKTAELAGQQGVVNLTTPGRTQEVRVLNYRAVLRVCMKSDAPRAARELVFSQTELVVPD